MHFEANIKFKYMILYIILSHVFHMEKSIIIQDIANLQWNILQATL